MADINEDEGLTETYMLSEKQVRAIVLQVNEDINLPFIREKREEELIAKYVNRINHHLVPAFNAVVGPMFCKCIKLSLSEELPLAERRRQICKIMRGELSQPVTDALNEKVDVRGLPESMEGSILKAVVDKMIKEFVEWTVGEIDERVNESLREMETVRELRISSTDDQPEGQCFGSKGNWMSSTFPTDWNNGMSYGSTAREGG